MIYNTDKNFLVQKLCEMTNIISRLDDRNTIVGFSLYKLNIIHRAQLLDLQNYIGEILEKCKDD